MQILLSLEIVEQLEKALRSAGTREIGGLLFAEHVGSETFRIVEISVQTKGGSHGSFVRDPVEHQEQLTRFFERTGEEHTRFNYLGEWHSHPSFPASPSGRDCETMTSLLIDPAVGVNFAVLLIIRRRSIWGLEMSATAFRPEHEPEAARVFAELKTKPSSPRRRRKTL